MPSDRRKAYSVGLNGKVTRTFLVYANSVQEAGEIMRGDRSECVPLDDHFEETSVSRAKREPGEDLDAE